MTMRKGNSAIVRSVLPQRLARRVFLRGSLYGVGVSVGLPLLDIMLDGNGTRLAHGAPLPLRFGVFHWGGGIAHNFWTPTGTGTAWTPKLSLEPFGAALKPYTTVVTGFNHPGSSPGHIPARGIALSNSHDLTKCTGSCVGTYRGQNMPEPSLDALVAESWGNVTRFPLLAVRVGDKGPYRANSSWQRGGRTYNRHDIEPGQVFNRVFGGGLPTREVGVLQVSTAHEKSMLDVLRQDAEALKLRLGKTDRMRLDQHLEGVRTLEQRLQVATQPGAAPAAGQVCSKPALQGTASSKSTRAKLHAEVLAHALACDLTRIFSFEWSSNQSEETYPEVGMNTPHHQFTHGQSGSELHGKVLRFIMEHYAYLGEQLMARREGAGNVLDSTLVFGTSEHANAGSHNWSDHPLLFVGKAGGRFKAGQHLRQVGGSAPKVLLTAVRAVGLNVAKVGHEQRAATEVVGELMA
jgi:hypothetical protein